MNVQFGWFDIVAALMLLAGVMIGRKRGMSHEILDMLQWLVIVVVGAHYYQHLGDLLSQNTPSGMLLSYVGAYVIIALAAKIVFTNLKRAAGEKIFSKDFFGRYEFYLGAVGGLVRFACMVLAFLAVVNGPLITAQQREKQKKALNESFGSSDFPTLVSFQDDILNRSYTGRTVREKLPDMLIKPTIPGGGRTRTTIATKEQRVINDITSDGKGANK